jgi:hypothetical protein
LISAVIPITVSAEPNQGDPKLPKIDSIAGSGPNQKTAKTAAPS